MTTGCSIIVMMIGKTIVDLLAIARVIMQVIHMAIGTPAHKR